MRSLSTDSQQDTEAYALELSSAPVPNGAKLTPMWAQYKEIKEQFPDVVLLFRLGDFFECFGADAECASKILGLVLTAREAGKGFKMPMCGFPAAALDRYVAQLIKAGQRVAVCDQMEAAQKSKLVRRQVTRVVSAGTATSPDLLDESQGNFLAAVWTPTAKVEVSDCAVAFCELSTGELLCCQFGDFDSLCLELGRVGPSEILYPHFLSEEKRERLQRTGAGCLRSYEFPVFDLGGAEEFIANHYKVRSAKGFGLPRLATEAVAVCLDYVKRNALCDLAHIAPPALFAQSDRMLLDGDACRNLELTEPLWSKDRRRTLYGALNQTLTAGGARLLRSHILQPLRNVTEISKRQDVVECFVKDAVLLAACRERLRHIPDMERIVGRIALKQASPRDVRALALGLQESQALAHLAESAPPIASLAQSIGQAFDFTELILSQLTDDPPMSITEGGIFRDGVSAELDSLRGGAQNGRQWILELESQERERTQIKSLKVGYNSVFGYFIEVTKSNIPLVPKDYIRKQTTANTERYVTPELKQMEQKILGATERANALEKELFEALCARILEQAAALRTVARGIAEMDVYCSHAVCANTWGYIRPRLNAEGRISIKAGRHPVVERYLTGNRFVPNDLEMHPSSAQLLIITGPNMSGKSTFLRQTALICVMGQLGAFVPAAEADLPLVDRIFTRVGAADDLSSGESTFMVEMMETARILNSATADSLVLLDEVGRGTSTYDGLAIAWSVAEALVRIGPKTLFATHYHHLNNLADQLEGVRNLRAAVRETEEKIIWLHKILPGGTDRSYGLEVARLAGVPREVIARAREILEHLEKDTKHLNLTVAGKTIAPSTRKVQMTLFEGEHHPLVSELKGLDTYALSPIEALNILHEMKKKAES